MTSYSPLLPLEYVAIFTLSPYINMYSSPSPIVVSSTYPSALYLTSGLIIDNPALPKAIKA
jgi:hypothetical protein